MQTLPDLRDLKAIEAWEQERLREGWSDGQLRTAYEETGTALGLLRSMRHIRGGVDETELTRAYAQRAKNATVDRLEQLLAESVLGASYIVQGRVQGLNEVSGALAAIPMLERGLRSVREYPDRGTFGGEVEFRFLYALGYAHFLRDDAKTALGYASEAITAAFALETAREMSRAKALYAMALMSDDRLHEALLLRESSFSETMTPRTRHNYRVQSSVLLFFLGNFPAALDAIDSAQTDAFSEHERRAWHQIISAMTGLGGLEEVETDYKGAANNAWLASGARHLLLHQGYSPVRQNDEARRLELRAVLLACEHGSTERMRYGRLFEHWLRGIAHTWAGEYGLAAQELSRAAPAEEMLFARTLIAGLKLELALKVGDFGPSPILEVEQELRDVFTVAGRLSKASASALADVLHFWHPAASAYAALMPGPIPLCRPALDGVVRLGAHHVAHGVTLPPMFVAERLLLALGVSIAPPDLNPAMRRQRDALKSLRGTVPYWRSFTSGAQLAYGLYRAGERSANRAAYEQAARQVVRDFGVVPALKTEYAATELHELAAAVEDLLEGHLTARGFARALQTI